ncbi:hypothetical protein LPJ55_004321 [Coemansia sp. RSA 990]|nr:hypothetical protein LPJ68_003646 [Coemansia sp. RSA 1086]KAJ1748917.1 hypothetical protein LPJ79_004152 [Coemansia sp. RSA 1821]KAJ1870887.1 hypothetical protein LPJ55_004321 [Coemansia sp. RSA 990]KAJ2672709.1 hypothetical protein IWW42_002658 [Coemansia sp. RSA 1085]
MTKYQIFTVDAFASEPFTGNQAGIVPVPSWQPIPDETMHKLAAEMNISETAYLTPVDHLGEQEFQQASRFTLRWFTPTVEVRLCGHATLAAAHILAHELGNHNEEFRFDTLGGVLVVRKSAEGLEMTFPLDIPAPVSANDNFELLAKSVFGYYSDSMEMELSPGLRYLVIHDPHRSAQDIAALQPRVSEALEAGRRERVEIVIATGRGEQEDFVSRVFGPWCGITEDPATGSAHTVLAPFWSKRLQKSQFVAKQCSKRGGVLSLQLDKEHVRISGSAVVVVKGSVEL